jgi:hypothetical protein
MPVLIRRTKFGRQAIPIGNSEIGRMLVEGTARKINSAGQLYEEVPDAMQAEAPQSPTKEVIDQEYETKVMVASTPKSKPRPKKGAQ